MHLSAHGKNTDYTKLETALRIYPISVLRAHGQSRFDTTAHRRRYNSSKIYPHYTITCEHALHYEPTRDMMHTAVHTQRPKDISE